MTPNTINMLLLLCAHDSNILQVCGELTKPLNTRTNSRLQLTSHIHTTYEIILYSKTPVSMKSDTVVGLAKPDGKDVTSRDVIDNCRVTRLQLSHEVL